MFFFPSSRRVCTLRSRVKYSANIGTQKTVIFIVGNKLKQLLCYYDIWVLWNIYLRTEKKCWPHNWTNHRFFRSNSIFRQHLIPNTSVLTTESGSISHLTMLQLFISYHPRFTKVFGWIFRAENNSCFEDFRPHVCSFFWFECFLFLLVSIMLFLLQLLRPFSKENKKALLILFDQQLNCTQSAVFISFSTNIFNFAQCINLGNFHTKHFRVEKKHMSTYRLYDTVYSFYSH